MASQIRRCIHGYLRRHSNYYRCECDHYWQGSDCSIRNCLAGVLNTTTFACDCLHGYGGEFCQLNVCLHRGMWYCDDADTGRRELCPDHELKSWIAPTSSAAAGDWGCSCGRGTRIFSNSTNDCLCEQGYYGEFCQRRLCDDNNGRSQSENFRCANGTLVSSGAGADDFDAASAAGGGIFGLGLSSDLILAVLLMTTFLITFLVLTRLFANKFRRCGKGGAGRSPEEEEIAVFDHYRTWRSSRNRYQLPPTADIEYGGKYGGGDATKIEATDLISQAIGLDSTSKPLQDISSTNSFHEIFWWKNNHQRTGGGDRSAAHFHVLDTVLEENGDLEEDEEDEKVTP